MDLYLVALFVLFAYIAFLYLIRNNKTLARFNISVYGPFLMWRTERGKRFIDRVAKAERFWNAYAAIGKVIVLGAMAFITALLVWEATIVSRIPAESAPTPELLIGIPGINPLIPVWYGILGLVVAIVLHEFAHGILTRVGGMKLKALGLIFAIIPMGAFVEPDEEELVKTTKKKRSSVYAVGPATNVIVALVFVILFTSAMAGNAQPVRDNPLIVGIGDNGPADIADLKFGMQIVEIDGFAIDDVDAYRNVTAPEPGSTVTLSYFFEDELRQSTVFSGVVITSVTGDFPADDAGIEKGMIVHTFNGTVIHNEEEFSQALKATLPGQTVEAVMLEYDDATDTYIIAEDIGAVTLESRMEYLLDVAPDEVDDDFEDYGMLGVNSAYLGAAVNSPENILSILAHPYRNADSVGEYISGSLVYLALPFMGLAPVPPAVADLFEPTGMFSGWDSGVFWILANCFYWIFWINIMVGLTNALPAVPLDGGYLFRDWMDSIVARFKKGSDEKERERYVSTVSYIIALSVLMLILWQLIGPRVL
jgi:membrane-associated protease RseP (regulator of RpoE activity)